MTIGTVDSSFLAGRLRGFALFLLLTFCLLATAVSSRAADLLLKNGTLLTVTHGTLRKTDLLIRGGKITAIGKNLKTPAGARVMDMADRYVMPGIIDAHSHLCIEGGVNEMAEVVSAEVDIQDVINAKDAGIKTMLSRGVTTINTMHGSANPIGGLTATLKMRWGRSADEMLFAGARRHIKFALGENPKRIHAERGVSSRLGVAETLREQFLAAREYQRDWDEYNRRKQAGLSAVPPRKDLRLESLAGVLRGEIWIQCHCYRADEIEMLLRLSDEFGFHIAALQHVLEGYKVAPEIAARNVGASTFADFWGYKMEAYDGIAQNAAALMQWGVRTSINSDWPAHVCYLNLDAGKSVRNGGLTPDECLAMVTLHPAWQLGIDRQVGSLEVGKDADIAVFDAHPLSPYGKCILTLIDGEVYFERRADGVAVFGIETPTATNAGNTSPAAPTPNAQRPTPNSASFVPLSVPVTAKPTGPATFAIVGARIVPVSAPPIENGTVVVVDGRIAAVGTGVAIPPGARVINGNGLSVYPGIINAATTLGLSEVGSVAETQDTGERGPLMAQLRAIDAYNTHSAYVGVALCSGVTTALVSPHGMGWMGQSALMHTAGRTIEEATVAADIAQCLSLSGNVRAASRGDMLQTQTEAAPSGAVTGSESAGTQVQKALSDARDYGRQLDVWKRGADPSMRPPKPNPLLAALVPASRRERPVLIAANQKEDVEQAVNFGLRNGAQVLITGGLDADRAAAALTRNGVPVIYTGMMNLPAAVEAYDKPMTGPLRLWQAGVKFCIATSDTPNIVQHAALAAAFGLPREEALKAITLYPAQILGVERDLGSIEPGKIADLLLTDGDPLDFTTRIHRLFINGMDMPLVSKHSLLYDEYRKK